MIDQVLATRHLDLSEAARALALVYLAAADASIACWDAKYTYNSWRPLPAIRGGAVDGTDFTQADPLWQPFLATPAHPEYPSGHSTNSSAMAATLQGLFGDPDVPLSVVIFDSSSNTNITRRWETFSEAVDEVIEARIYSGIHYCGRSRRPAGSTDGPVRPDTRASSVPRPRLASLWRSIAETSKVQRSEADHAPDEHTGRVCETTTNANDDQDLSAWLGVRGRHHARPIVLEVRRAEKT